MLRPVARRLPVAAVLVALMAGPLVGCGTKAKPAAAPTASTPAVTTPAAPSPTGLAVSADPLTGDTAAPAGPVVAVKVDNETLARPYQRGLDGASIIYQELIEGGATRLLAIFTGAGTAEIGPCRSARESDLELLAQYGRVGLAFSGANRGVLASVAKADVVNLEYGRLPSAYRVGERRADATNFYTSLSRLAGPATAGGAVGAKDVGLRFGDLPPGLGAPASAATATFSPGVTTAVRYDPAGHRYYVTMDGRSLSMTNDGVIAPANVIVAFVPVRNSGYADVLGHVTPYTTTTGTGRVVVLRDGVAIEGSWRRGAPQAGTALLDPTGRDIPLHVGRSLILLLPQQQPLRLS